MGRFRTSLVALSSAAMALFSVLFVATAALAVSSVDAAPHVAMSSDMPCDQERASCSTDCAVLCHALVMKPPMVEGPLGHTRPTYSVMQTVLTSFGVEAEDPPPR